MSRGLTKFLGVLISKVTVGIFDDVFTAKWNRAADECRVALTCSSTVARSE